MNHLRIKNTLKQLNKIGYSEQGMNRLAFTKKEEKVKNLLIHLLEKEDVKVKVDACGNVIARKEGQKPKLPPVVVGSHLDTVFNGGQYDGTVGVVLGLELIRSLKEQNIQHERAIEVISFSGEEASRFGSGTIGSKAIAGKLNKEKMAKLTDNEGIIFQKAVEEAGLDFNNMNRASRKMEKIQAFFEVHIEQGPILEKKRKRIGVVTDIAAPTRLKVSILGKASHSGTTPMNYRKDALLGASEIALAVEKMAKSEAAKGTVATVGECNVFPGAINVVPGQAEIKIDIRGTDMISKQKVFTKLIDCFNVLNSRRQLEIAYEVLSDDKPVELDEKLISSLSETCEQLDIPYLQMISGAGHDAMNMASICPAGLIFIPCRDGLSHHKDEYASIDDIVAGGEVLEKEVLKWTGSFNNQE